MSEPGVYVFSMRMFGWLRIQGREDEVVQLGTNMRVPVGSVEAEAEATAHLMDFKIEAELKAG